MKKNRILNTSPSTLDWVWRLFLYMNNPMRPDRVEILINKIVWDKIINLGNEANGQSLDEQSNMAIFVISISNI